VLHHSFNPRPLASGRHTTCYLLKSLKNIIMIREHRRKRTIRYSVVKDRPKNDIKTDECKLCEHSRKIVSAWGSREPFK
jgi:hypothetical protein